MTGSTASIYYPVIRSGSGADVYFERLARGVSACGWEANLHFLPHVAEIVPYTLLRRFLQVKRGSDIIHTKAEYGWMYAGRGKPLVVTLGHSHLDPQYDKYKSRVKRLYHRHKWGRSIARSFRAADRIVAVSRFVARQIREHYGREDARVIYNGVDVDFFRPASTERPPITRRPIRLLFIGNLTRRKGFPLLAPILERLGQGYVLEYTTGLRTRGATPPHPAMVPLGRLSREELLEAYQRCDILLFPTRLEGFGYPAAEAMACGKPVVCTDYSSLPELVTQGQGGFLCPLDDVNAFAQAIHRLAADPNLRARMGAFNRARAEAEFSLQVCVQNYLSLYRELL